MHVISSLKDLEENYGQPVAGATWKEVDHITEHYRQFIEKSPFLILATHGENGLDCSPRGDPPGFVRVVNPKCVQIPDRRGNNRLDSLRNIVQNPQVALIFLIPGVGETIRLSGTAKIIVDQDLRESFAINGKAAASVLSIDVDKIYFQYQKALVRSRIWGSSQQIARSELPSTGEMLKVFADAQGVDFQASEYDNNYPDHMKKTIY